MTEWHELERVLRRAHHRVLSDAEQDVKTASYEADPERYESTRARVYREETMAIRESRR